MIDKDLIKMTMFYFHGDEYNEIDDFCVEKFEQRGSNLFLNPRIEDDEDTFVNIYEFGIRAKEYLEHYAKEVNIKGIWIDLNDLSKDEAYYFRHCNEVFEDLIQYELIMETEQ